MNDYWPQVKFIFKKHSGESFPFSISVGKSKIFATLHAQPTRLNEISATRIEHSFWPAGYETAEKEGESQHLVAMRAGVHRLLFEQTDYLALNLIGTTLFERNLFFHNADILPWKSPSISVFFSALIFEPNYAQSFETSLIVTYTINPKSNIHPASATGTWSR